MILGPRRHSFVSRSDYFGQLFYRDKDQSESDGIVDLFVAGVRQEANWGMLFGSGWCTTEGVYVCMLEGGGRLMLRFN